MRFFDSKEEVLDIQLTQYGKQLLSKGKFMPTYYSFHDDDIIYDMDYVSVTEVQNSSEGRIQENTPRLRTQYVFEGIETNIQKLNTPDVLEDKKHVALPYSLGTSSPRSIYLPSWTISFLEGNLLNSTTFITGSKQVINIPQLTTKIEPIVSIKTHTGEIPLEELNDAPGFFEFRQEIYSDGTYVDAEEKFLLLEVDEENSVFKKENFDIEIYEVNNKGATNEELIQLNFALPDADIMNTELNEQFVEHYFDIQFDDEIDHDIIAARRLEKVKNIYADRDIFRRSQKKTESADVGKREDIYRIDLEPDDFEEPCD